MTTKLDAAADSMKATMNSERRRQEAEYGTMMCATHDCPREACDGSCYCESCEDAYDKPDCSHARRPTPLWIRSTTGWGTTAFSRVSEHQSGRDRAYVAILVRRMRLILRLDG